MTQAFKTLVTYMGYIANIQQYQSWSGDFVKEEYFAAIENIKKAFRILQGVMSIDVAETITTTTHQRDKI